MLGKQLASVIYQGAFRKLTRLLQKLCKSSFRFSGVIDCHPSLPLLLLLLDATICTYAPTLQAGGQGFESPLLHHLNFSKYNRLP